MERPTKWWSLTLALVAASGCATINAGVDKYAKEAGVPGGSRLILYGTVTDVQVFHRDRPDKPLPVVIVPNPTFMQAVGNSVNQSLAQAQANHTGGTVTYNTTTRWSPAIYLNQKANQPLRIVHRDGRVVEYLARPRIAKRVVAIDWLLFTPTLGLSVIIDAWTQKWKWYESVNVDELFRQRAANGAAAREEAADAAPPAQPPTPAPPAPSPTSPPAAATPPAPVVP
jgi:hypothetical protein